MLSYWMMTHFLDEIVLIFKSYLIAAYGVMLCVLLSSCGFDDPQSEVITIDGIEIRLNYRPVRGTVPGEIIHPAEMLLVDGTEAHNPEEAMLIRPRDVIAGPNEELFVLDDYQVKVFSLDGEYIRSFGRRGNGPGEFDLPLTIRLQNREEVVVGERPASRITRFSLEGEYIGRLALQFPGIVDITPAPKGGYVLCCTALEGDIFGGTRYHFLRSIDEKGELRSFQTEQGERDTLHIARYQYTWDAQFSRNITNEKVLINTPDNQVLALGHNYTFYHVNENGLYSAFRRVADAVRYPAWRMADIRRRSREQGSPMRFGFHLEPQTSVVDERGHLWVTAYDQAYYNMTSSREELLELKLLPLDEFDENGRWLRQVLIEIPEGSDSMRLTDAAYGYLFGYIFPGSDMETSPVIRFRRP